MRAVDYAKTRTPLKTPGAQSVPPVAPLHVPAPVRPRLLTAALILGATIVTASAIHSHLQQPAPINDLAMLTQAANAGENGAELQLGLAWRAGRLGLPVDETKAAYWIHRAALDGNSYAAQLEGKSPAPSALQRLGSFAAEIGAIFTRSGNADLTAAAAAGDAQAQYQLAMRYRDGSWGVARDDAASRLWLERAAQGGNKVAMGTLARAYDDGQQGFPRDPEQARQWRERASAVN